jgi:hypothetical protein
MNDLATGQSTALNPPAEPSGPYVSGQQLPLSAGDTNLILNGDFENTTVTDCAYNLTNAEFNSVMADAFAFGLAEQLDVMNDPTGCGYLGPPVSGTVKLGMSSDGTPGQIDAFSLALSSPVVSGLTYTVSFYGWQWGRSFAPDIGPVQIGLSNDAYVFGTQVFEATPDTTGWNYFAQTFVAPVGAAHLTVQAGDAGDTWIHVDDISLVEEPATPVEATTWGRVKFLYE